MSGTKNKVVISYEQCHRVNNNNIIEKLCNKCFKWIELNSNNFYKNKSAPDGYFPNCIDCNRDASYKRYLSDTEKSNQNNKEWYLKNKDYKDERSRDYCREHKEEVSETQRIWQQTNSKKCIENSKKYQHKKHKIKTKEWEACKKYFIHRCTYCGLPIEEHWIQYRRVIKLGDFHKEHVDHFGKNDLSNCVPSCKSCNSSKHEYKVEEWYPRQEFYSKERYDKIIQWITDDYKQFICH